MIDYIVKVRYTEFKFSGSAEAIKFAEAAIIHGTEENEVTITLLYKPEEVTVDE